MNAMTSRINLEKRVMALIEVVLFIFHLDVIFSLEYDSWHRCHENLYQQECV